MEIDALMNKLKENPRSDKGFSSYSKKVRADPTSPCSPTLDIEAFVKMISSPIFPLFSETPEQVF